MRMKRGKTPAWRSAQAGLPLLLLLALSACGGGQAVRSTAQYPSYAPPGPPEDPWGPYIREASSRFSVPDRWIRQVMRQESGGHEYLNGQPTTSDAGAAGLMQVMPQTYAELSAHYNLGPDPYNPHDNILAGTAYIREMYDRFGSPAFLAAYNAGPQRVQDYLAGRSNLPNETVNYVAAIAPRLGNDLPMSGPLMAYADHGGAPLTPDPVPQAYAVRKIARCWRDPDAAYDPDAPCQAAPARIAAVPRPTPAQPVASQNTACWHDPNLAYDPDAPCQPRPVEIATAPPPPQAPRQAENCWHDPNAAYDPDAPCRPAPVQMAQATPQPTAPGQVLWGNAAPPQRAAPPPPVHRSFASYLVPSAAAAEPPPMHASGAWSVQVGAFADSTQARQVANASRGLAPQILASTRIVLGATTPFGGHVLYRARLAGLSAEGAASACRQLASQGQACVTVPPGG